MSKKKTILIIAIIITTLIVLAGTIFLIQKYKNTVLPGVAVAGVDIGGQKTDKAMIQMEDVLTEFLSENVVIMSGDAVVEFTPADLGINFDYKKTKELLPTILNGFGFLISGRGIEPVVTIDEDKLLSVISILDLESSAQNAYLSLDPNLKEVVLVEEKWGVYMDEKTFIEDLNEKFTHLSDEPITINLQKIEPAIKASDVEPFMELSKNILTKKITISYDSKQWIFSASEYSNLISFGTKSTFSIGAGMNQSKDAKYSLLHNMSRFADAKLPIEWSDGEKSDMAKENSFVQTGINVVIDSAGLDNYVEDLIAAEIKTSAENVSITMDDAGVVTFEGSAKNGMEVNNDALKDMLELALENEIDAIDLPTKIIESETIVSQNLADMGIKELISVGYTDFSGSPYNRTLNIGVGLSKFNGILIEPGKTFSFVDSLGPVDAENGYYKELVITGDETKPEYGGGLCQVSSTMFRAILYGGLPIVERTEHSYAVSYYAYPSGYGLDATIYQPSPDLKFTNDTGSYILVQAYSEGTSAYFKFYGTDDGRTVIMDGPYYNNRTAAPADVIIYTTELTPGEKEKKDSAHNGFDATWYRTIISSEGTETKETIFSHYQAWPAKYLVGIAEEESGSGTVAE